MKLNYNYTIPFIVSGILWFINSNRRRTYNGLRETFSTLDGNSYYVQNTSNATDAANLIAQLQNSVKRTMNYIHQLNIEDLSPHIQQGVKVLKKKHPYGSNVNIYELNPQKSQAIAYNQNKSDLFICLREQPPYDTLASHDTVLFIVLHELAHTMQPGYAKHHNGKTIHDAQFRQSEHFLMNTAKKLGLIYPSNIPGRKHCGRVMPDPNTAM